MTKDEALKLALEALEESHPEAYRHTITAIKEALMSGTNGAQPETWEKFCDSNCVWTDHHPDCKLAEPEPVLVTDNTYGYAKSLAEAIFKQHFSSDEHYASGRIVWDVNDTVIGILTQIDNMVADMVRKPELEPVAWVSSEELLVMRGNALGGAKDWRINVGLVKQNGDVGLYTIPPQRTWVGLSVEEFKFIASKYLLSREVGLEYFQEEIEGKLKEKNI